MKSLEDFDSWCKLVEEADRTSGKYKVIIPIDRTMRVLEHEELICYLFDRYQLMRELTTNIKQDSFNNALEIRGNLYE